MVVYTLSNGQKLNEKRFVRYFEKKVLYAIRKFNLINKSDKVAVACSGGKDSNVVLYILNKLCTQRRQQIEAIAIDEGIKGYRDNLLKSLKEFCKREKIKLHIFSFKKEGIIKS